MARFLLRMRKKHCEHAIINERSVVKAKRTANLHRGWEKNLEENPLTSTLCNNF